MPIATPDILAAWLTAEAVSFRHMRHEPAHTSEESARVRGEPLELGGKALLLKVGADFRLFVLSAARKLDSESLKRHFGARKLRFASTAELLELTGLVPGSVPPFGRPILPFDLYVDESMLQNPRIAFNAASLTESIILSMDDYLRLSRPVLLSFSR